MVTMTAPDVTARRLVVCGYAAVASAVIALAVGLTDLLADDSVPKSQWSYPLTPTVLWYVSVALALVHVLQALGFVGIAIAQPYGASRAAHVTTWVAVGGFVLFAVAELLSGAIGGQDNDSGAAGVVGGVFGVATLLTAIGGVVAGIAILRRRQWTGPGAWSVLLTAVAILLLVTPANISGAQVPRTVALLVWSLLFVPLGLAVARSRPADG